MIHPFVWVNSTAAGRERMREMTVVIKSWMKSCRLYRIVGRSAMCLIREAEAWVWSVDWNEGLMMIMMMI